MSGMRAEKSIFAITSTMGIVMSGLLAAAEPRSKADMLCGPRCVTYLLQHYGHQCELVDKGFEAPALREGDTALRSMRRL